LRRAFASNRRLLTRRVKGGIRKFVRHAPDNAVILAKYKPANCRL
jgi:transposase